MDVNICLGSRGSDEGISGIIKQYCRMWSARCEMQYAILLVLELGY